MNRGSNAVVVAAVVVVTLGLLVVNGCLLVVVNEGVEVVMVLAVVVCLGFRNDPPDCVSGMIIVY